MTTKAARLPSARNQAECPFEGKTMSAWRMETTIPPENRIEASRPDLPEDSRFARRLMSPQRMFLCSIRRSIRIGSRSEIPGQKHRKANQANGNADDEPKQTD